MTSHNLPRKPFEICHLANNCPSKNLKRTEQKESFWPNGF